MSESLMMLTAGLGGVALGALLIYGVLARMQRNLVASLTLELEMQHQEQLHELALRDASVQQELKQSKLTCHSRENELSLLREKLQALAHQFSDAQQSIAGLREKETQAIELKQQLIRKEQQLLVLEVSSVELKTTLDQERKSFNEQLQLLQNAKLELVKEFENTAHKIFEGKQQSFTQNSKSLLDATLDPLRAQLTDFKKKVEDVYEKESAERNRLAGQVVELQKQAQKIGEDAVNLAQALKGNSKTQGNWGEVILERLLEESGLQKGREYDTQVSFTKADGSRLMPDVVIRLPEAKDIVVDAKCSLVDYERFCSAESDAERKQYLTAHVNSLRAHIKNLSIKDYEKIEGIRSLDFVFIFIPIEAAFLFALQHDPSLYREAYDRHIILVSPTTLLATLRTVDNIWRYEKQNKNAERIAKEAGALHDQFVLLLDSLDSLGGYLNKTQEAYNKARDRLQYGRGNLVKRVDDIRRLGAKTKKVIPENLLEGAGVDSESLAVLNEGDDE